MTTAQDLLIVSLDVPPVRPVEQGELSLALAGAEAVDLVVAEALAVDGDRLVPGLPPAPREGLLDQAVSLLVRVEPYESVEDWLWRRGRGLAAAYIARLEADGLLTRPRGRPFAARPARPEPVDSPARRRAAERWARGEPVLAALAAAAGIRDEPAGGAPDEPAGGVPDEPADAVVTVLAAVGDAVTELVAVRQRRSVEDAAFDNVWRGL
ncbi:GPP34 family phosphoprotein [Streptomyces sp. NPDC017936]|uniref:GOLPH3/VPS74 family protein n=1 Tax=Streptomyces sp. NPDC017936 TaxID=3365016 RepID=UPI00378A2ED6